MNYYNHFKKGGAVLLVIGSLVMLTACPKKTSDPNPKTTETTIVVKLSKNWGTKSVSEEGNLVFTSNGSSNVKPGYGYFKLDLRSQSTAKLTEYDTNTFTGTWSISADEKKLTLSGLNPEPTGTGGTIIYNIDSITDTALKMTRNSLNKKTGASQTSYELTNK